VKETVKYLMFFNIELVTFAIFKALVIDNVIHF